MRDVAWIVITVLVGFAMAIFAAMYASVYVAGLIVVATAYVAYVIKTEKPTAPNVFKGITKDEQ